MLRNDTLLSQTPSVSASLSQFACLPLCHCQPLWPCVVCCRSSKNWVFSLCLSLSLFPSRPFSLSPFLSLSLSPSPSLSLSPSLPLSLSPLPSVHVNVFVFQFFSFCLLSVSGWLYVWVVFVCMFVCVCLAVRRPVFPTLPESLYRPLCHPPSSSLCLCPSTVLRQNPRPKPVKQGWLFVLLPFREFSWVIWQVFLVIRYSCLGLANLQKCHEQFTLKTLTITGPYFNEHLLIWGHAAQWSQNKGRKHVLRKWWQNHWQNDLLDFLPTVGGASIMVGRSVLPAKPSDEGAKTPLLSEIVESCASC